MRHYKTLTVDELLLLELLMIAMKKRYRRNKTDKLRCTRINSYDYGHIIHKASRFSDWSATRKRIFGAVLNIQFWLYFSLWWAHVSSNHKKINKRQTTTAYTIISIQNYKMHWQIHYLFKTMHTMKHSEVLQLQASYFSTYCQLQVIKMLLFYYAAHCAYWQRDRREDCSAWTGFDWIKTRIWISKEQHTFKDKKYWTLAHRLVVWGSEKFQCYASSQHYNYEISLIKHFSTFLYTYLFWAWIIQPMAP